ncbi:hypothetical protein ACF3M1_08775 [Luteimonas sp. WGS1318]|uniref:hypothetical protein n=1 Tax=Luteimonas sp. WGS1318 TaxID=3366815 RepID=UPI00372D5DEC
MNSAVRQDLVDQLDALGAAIDTDAFDDAAARMTAYDAALRHYIDSTAPNTPVDVLRELLKMQNAVLLHMRERQTVIGDALRQGHRQDAASRAYAETAP